jgi:hypothetical protein
MATTTIVYDNNVSETTVAISEGDNLWLPIDTLHNSTDWELTPEGACIGTMCIPIPTGREEEFFAKEESLFNLAALERHMGRPILHDEPHSTWLFGRSTTTHVGFQNPIQAPDFTLPDLQGNLYSLSDFKGKKIFLVSWASW